MSHHPPCPPMAIAARVDPDAIERAVLGTLVSLHPVQLTLDELVRELSDVPGHTPDAFAACDRINNAVRQLVRAGLLHRHGPFVLPTRAALRALELGIG